MLFVREVLGLLWFLHSSLFYCLLCIDTWHNYCIRKLNSSKEIDFITSLRRRQKHGHKFRLFNLSLRVLENDFCAISPSLRMHSSPKKYYFQIDGNTEANGQTFCLATQINENGMI